MKKISYVIEFICVACFLLGLWLSQFVKRHYVRIALALVAAGLAIALMGAGCAPTQSEWDVVSAMPDGPDKIIAIHELQKREADEEGWWDFAAILASSFIPGGALGVYGLHRARRAQLATRSVVKGTKRVVDEAVPTASRDAAIRSLKDQQDKDGTRDDVDAVVQEIE